MVSVSDGVYNWILVCYIVVKVDWLLCIWYCSVVIVKEMNGIIVVFLKNSRLLR